MDNCGDGHDKKARDCVFPEILPDWWGLACDAHHRLKLASSRLRISARTQSRYQTTYAPWRRLLYLDKFSLFGDRCRATALPPGQAIMAPGHPEKHCRTDSDTSTSPQKHRRLSHPRPDASFAERNDLCESTGNPPLDQVWSPSSTNSDRKTIEPPSTKGNKRGCLLSSPPTNSVSQPEQSDQLPQSGRSDLPQRPKSAPENTVAEFGCAFDTEQPTYHPQAQERKRSKASPEAEEEHPKPHKKRQAATTTDTSSVLSPTGTEREKEEYTEASTPMSFWAHTGRWPENFSAMDQEPSNLLKKRPLSSSYTKSYKDGEVPKAYSAAYVKHLAEHGLIMDELKGGLQVHQDSKSLCTSLLSSIHAEPQYTTFPLERFSSVRQQTHNRNKARVCRDLRPLLVPSPELLYICGHDRFEHLVEEISVEWSNRKTLGGPKPKPDFAVGIARSAFSEEETAKLRSHQSHERPTMFTDNMYFPFLLCEAKCTNEVFNRADCQNMHSSSLAVDAILQLHRAADESKVTELSGQILVFSVSHDTEWVKLYGHFAVVEGERACFYRYPIAALRLTFEEEQGRKRTHDFVRAVYDEFYPAHLKRICDALAAVKAPPALSVTSYLDTEDEVEVAHLRQQLGQKEEREAVLQKQLGDLLKQQAEQAKESARQLTESARQLTEQKEQYQEQVRLLKQLLDRG